MKKSLFALMTIFSLHSFSAFAGQAFYVVDDGGEHAPAGCDKLAEVPDVEMQDDLSNSEGYLGSKIVERADQNQAGVEIRHHYYASEGECKNVLWAIAIFQGYPEVKP